MSTKKEANAKTENANKPVAKIRLNLIHGSIWERKSEQGTFYATTRSSYRSVAAGSFNCPRFLFFFRRGAVCSVGMDVLGERHEFGLELVGINPGTA